MNYTQWTLTVTKEVQKYAGCSYHEATARVGRVMEAIAPDAPLGLSWLERWFKADTKTPQAARNVCSYEWGWRPAEPNETP